MLCSVCKTLNTTLYKPLSTMLRSTMHTVLSSVAQMLCTILYIAMCNLWFTMLRKMWAEFTMRYIARNVIQTVYHNVVQCLQNVKHNVVQATVDNDTLNLARSVIQCRTNYSLICKNVVHYIVYNSLQPVVYSVAQNVSKIQKCAVFCKVLHVHLLLTMLRSTCTQCLKNRRSVVNNVGNSIRQTAFHSVVQKKGHNVVSCTIASSA